MRAARAALSLADCGWECDADWRMSGDWDEDLCKKALVLVEELCFNSPRGYSQSERCQEFSYLLRGRNRQLDTGEASAEARAPPTFLLTQT